MKKIIFLFVLVLWCSSISAQCPTRDLKLKSQQDVNDFCNGITDCTITVKLEIDGGKDESITDLSGLSCITAIAAGG